MPRLATSSPHHMLQEHGAPNCIQRLELRGSSLLWVQARAGPSGMWRQSNCRYPSKLGRPKWAETSSRRHFGRTDWRDMAHKSICRISHILVSDPLYTAGRSDRMCNRRVQRLGDAGLYATALLGQVARLHILRIFQDDVYCKLLLHVTDLASGTAQGALVQTLAPRLPPSSRAQIDVPV